MSPHKVLYIAPSVGIGGVETFLKHVSTSHSSSCTPYFLLFQEGPLGQWLESQDMTVFYCKNRPRLSRPWTWFLFQIELFRLIKNHQFNIVHASMAYAALFSWPCFYVTKFLWFQHGPVSGIMDRIAYILPSHGVIYNSDHTLQTQLQINSRTQPKPYDFILHLGTPSVDIDQRSAARKELLTHYRLNTDTIIISLACRLQRWKGAHIALAAIDIVLKNTNKPFVFLIYGDTSWDPTYAKELQRQSANLPVHFSKPVVDLTSIFLGSDIVINSSITPEPFGLTVIEAMSCGTVPIAANQGGPKEILEHDLKDCLFEPSNPEKLAEILVRFIEDERLLSVSKAKSFELFEQKFTLDTMIGQLESIYQKIISQH